MIRWLRKRRWLYRMERMLRQGRIADYEYELEMAPTSWWREARRRGSSWT